MISVIVATYNRADKLPTLLDSFLCAQDSLSVAPQLIIVDNNSNDNTQKIVVSYKDKIENLTLLYEPKQGLSNARNCGIASAEHDILAFTDDDCQISAEWMQGIASAFEKNIELSILCGAALSESHESSKVGTREQTYSSKISSLKDVLEFSIGCNLSIHKRVIEKVGNFDPTLGKGAKHQAAEDIDLVYRAVSEGSRAQYDPNVVIYHKHKRETAEEIDRVQAQYAIGRGAFYMKNIMGRDTNSLRGLYWETRSALSGLFSSRESRKLLSNLYTGAFRRLIHQ